MGSGELGGTSTAAGHGHIATESCWSAVPTRNTNTLAHQTSCTCNCTRAYKFRFSDTNVSIAFITTMSPAAKHEHLL